MLPHPVTTGYTPFNYGQQSMPRFIEDGWALRAGAPMLKYSTFIPNHAKIGLYNAIIYKGLQAVETGRLDPKEAAVFVVEELLDRTPAQMSGGQQQRVALARALVKEPQLLLLDEPLSNLDATLRLTMRSEIKNLQRQLGVTAILVTHDQLEATTMADRSICMSKGRIEQVGSPDDLYLRPESLFVAGFIGAPPINPLEGEIAGDTLRVNGASLSYRGQDRGAVVLGLRPEALRFEAGGLEGRITEVEPMGGETLYLVASDLGALRILEAGSQARHGLGEAVSLAFDREATMVFDRAIERRLQGHARVAG